MSGEFRDRGAGGGHPHLLGELKRLFETGRSLTGANRPRGLNGRTTRRWSALGLLASMQFLLVVDLTVVDIALPRIGEELGISAPGWSGWSMRTPSLPEACCSSEVGWRTSSDGGACS